MLMYVTGMKYFFEKTACSPPETLYVSENYESHWCFYISSGQAVSEKKAAGRETQDHIS